MHSLSQCMLQVNYESGDVRPPVQPVIMAVYTSYTVDQKIELN